MIDDKTLLKYIDGELDEQATAEVVEQLKRDPALQRHLDELRAVEAAYHVSLHTEDLPTKRREKFWERLRRASPAARYYLLRREDLQALALVRNALPLVFSLYLDLRPGRRGFEPTLTRFKNLLHLAEQQIRPDERSHIYREHWAEETTALRAWIEEEPVPHGKGLALLSSQAAGLWRAFELPVAVADRLEIADRPYLRPLATLLDEFERYLVVLIDAGTARVIEVYLGAAEEVADVEGYVPPASADLVEKTGHRHDTYLHRHAKYVLSRAEELWRERGCDWLVIGGSEEALGELRRLLPKTLRERLAGELKLSPEARLNSIVEQVLEIERQQERKIEAQRVEELVTSAHKHGPTVLGLDDTLLTIVEERVHLLVVEEEFAQRGYECPSCGFLAAGKIEICPLCGMPPIEQPDIVEVALQRVIERDGAIEVLRSPESRHALAQHGRIGALLRYAYTTVPVTEAEQQQGAEGQAEQERQREAS
jgi:peptide chain release factor subunit 1